VTLPFKTRCHREGCYVGCNLPSTDGQKLAGSKDSESRVLTVTPWALESAGTSALLQCRNDSVGVNEKVTGQ